MYPIIHISNLASIFAVIVCLTVTIIFIIRLNGGQSVGHARQQMISAKSMVEVNNPFFVKFPDMADKTLSDNVECDVHCQIPCRIQTFWGTLIKNTHWQIRKPWQLLLNGLFQNNILFDYSIQQDGHQLLDTGNHKLHLKTDISADKLGSSPRTRYPLVVIISPQDTHRRQKISVISLIVIVHLKDNICDRTSHVMYQLVKSNLGDSGHLCMLEQLYVNEDNYGSQILMEDSQSCVVCCNAPCSRALLPCRHVCVCGNCFKQLQKCPMCRTSISSYFCVKEEPLLDQDSSNEQPEQTWFDTLIHWNQRTNEFFGFV